MIVHAWQYMAMYTNKLNKIIRCTRIYELSSWFLNKVGSSNSLVYTVLSLQVHDPGTIPSSGKHFVIFNTLVGFGSRREKAGSFVELISQTSNAKSKRLCTTFSVNPWSEYEGRGDVTNISRIELVGDRDSASATSLREAASKSRRASINSCLSY